MDCLNLEKLRGRLPGVTGVPHDTPQGRNQENMLGGAQTYVNLNQCPPWWTMASAESARMRLGGLGERRKLPAGSGAEPQPPENLVTFETKLSLFLAYC